MDTDKNKIQRIIREEVQRIIGKDLDGIKDLLKGIDAQNKVLIQAVNRCVKNQEKLIAGIQLCLIEAAKETEALKQNEAPVISTLKEFLNRTIES